MDLRGITEFFKDFGTYILTILIMALIFTFVIALQPVAGNSMVPTLEEGAVVAVLRFDRNIIRNQIVVVKGDDNKSYIKRVVGLPGEKIDYLNGVLYVNGVGYKESFLAENVKTSNFLFEDICALDKCPNGVIPSDMYLILGDNRPESVDSRTPEFGLRSKSDIKGVVVFKVWPITNIGKLK